MSAQSPFPMRFAVVSLPAIMITPSMSAASAVLMSSARAASPARVLIASSPSLRARSARRNTKAAKRFLGKALRGLKDWELPEVLNTDKAPTYAAAIAELKAEGKCPTETRHRQVKYLNNVIEADHGKLKQLSRPVRGFKTLKTAYATIKGFEVMRALREGQAEIFALQGGVVGEARIVERAFGVGPCALTEAMAWLQDRLASAET